MSFLQPMLLAALPLIGLPILIHLINQRRYQTVRWGAMMFLLAANRMSRGYARIRQWMILTARMLAVGGLIFAVSRPLAGGWLGFAGGGRPETTIIVLDRSPSMRQTGRGGGPSKLETGVRQLVETLTTVGSSRWVLIESGSNRPVELDSPDALVHSQSAGPSSAASDMPAMLQAAGDYLRINKSGRADIWICSDLRDNDWNPRDNRWQALREAFLAFPQPVRVQLLAYPDLALGNLSVRVADVRRRQTQEGAELVLSIRVAREGDDSPRASLPLRFEVEGARSETIIEMTGPRYELKDHRLPIESRHARGWGRISIPADANPADNDFWFAFDQPATRRTVIVSDDPSRVRPLWLAASVPLDRELSCEAEVVAPSQLAGVDWEQTALVVWEAPLPGGEMASRLRAFVERGGSLIAYPAPNPGADELFGVRWTAWSEIPAGTTVDVWRGDHDLLAASQSGVALPVGLLEVRRYCGMAGEFTPLANLLHNGAPLLARATTNRGAAYFCATGAAPADSSLAANGVVLYAMVQRALAAGVSALEHTRLLVAGEPTSDVASHWQRVAGGEDATSADFWLHRGVYRSGERLLAVNRPAAEDLATVVPDDRIAALFHGLDFARVDGQAGGASSLIQEVWRLFLISMMAALLAEAALCLPKRAPVAKGTA